MKHFSNKKQVGMFEDIQNKIISNVYIKDNKLVFNFEDGSGVNVFDAGQNCCENRYMHSDDDLNYYTSSKLLNIEVAEGAEKIDEISGDCQESMFLHITTTRGVFVVANYNEHNGYYGGFIISLEKKLHDNSNPSLEEEVK